MCAEHKEPKYLKVIFFTNLPYGKEVAEGFGHLSVVNIQECIVHPVFCKGFSIGCLTLRNLVLMVRKYEIFSAGVDINGIPKIFLRHNGALNMPAGTAVAPW